MDGVLFVAGVGVFVVLAAAVVYVVVKVLRDDMGK